MCLEQREALYMCLIYHFKNWCVSVCVCLCVCLCVCVCVHAQLCLTLCDPMDSGLAWLLCLWDFPDKNTGVHFHFLLQGILLTQGLNPGLHCKQSPAWQVDSLTTEPPGMPKNY